MIRTDRRTFLLATAAAIAMPPAIARAVTIDAKVSTGTIRDVEHVVILMQENRSFDHYFGAMNGVRGFADRFPVPQPDGRTVWTQRNTPTRSTPLIAPFHLNTVQSFPCMRVEGTPHSWTDAQDAWNEGRMDRWPAFKTEHSMGHYLQQDIPFQYALADAFTICDAYHCSFQGGTNTNRLFLWTGTNDPSGKLGGPSISNSHDTLPPKGAAEPYTWTTYPERLQAAGVSWRIYEDMSDNFGDNPLVGFKTFRDSIASAPGADPRLAALGHSTRHLDGLREDVLANKLPQVSWIVSPAADSEHPGPSSPAQGADYIARVLEALTANPDVWAKTVFIINFDENDGFFDHVPPPAVPSLTASGDPLGGSTVDTAGEYHLARSASEAKSERDDLNARPYGLGPRVPLYVISPWSRGGYVNSQVFDHTSVIRFLETRFGVIEPNISAWRRSVCGDLTTAFNFRSPNHTPLATPFPATAAIAAKAGALPGHTSPPTPAAPQAPVQTSGVRIARALPYALNIREQADAGSIRLTFSNAGAAGAVFHVYDRTNLAAAPRRYTVGAGASLEGAWPSSRYDLYIIGPNGFHRHLIGAANGLAVSATAEGSDIKLALTNTTTETVEIEVTCESYNGVRPWKAKLSPGQTKSHSWPLSATRGWYDLSVAIKGDATFVRRFAGHVETGKDSITDPAMSGPAVMEHASRA
jgi:phospholipase C